MSKLIVEVISSFLYLMCKVFKILVLPFLLFGLSHKILECALTLFKFLFQGDYILDNKSVHWILEVADGVWINFSITHFRIYSYSLKFHARIFCTLPSTWFLQVIRYTKDLYYLGWKVFSWVCVWTLICILPNFSPQIGCRVVRLLIVVFFFSLAEWWNCTMGDFWVSQLWLFPFCKELQPPANLWSCKLIQIWVLWL